MMDSRVVLFIVHFLFNGDTSSFQTAPSARKCASSVFGKRTRLFQCKFCRHSLGKLGGVAVVWRDHHRQITNGVSSFLANLTKHRATCLPALLAPEAHVLPKLQPPLFLIRQHISPRALFMQPRPCSKLIECSAYSRRFLAISKNFCSISMPTKRLPSKRAASPMAPLPMKGSRIVPSGHFFMSRRSNGTGFSFGCFRPFFAILCTGGQ